MDTLAGSLARTLRTARAEQDLSVNALAERSGVSRAMITKIERGEAQPTAVLLGRLSGALGLTLSELIARAESTGELLRRAADQPIWTDPLTGYRRRALSPTTDGPLDLVEVDFPPGATVSYPVEVYTPRCQQLWVISGRLTFTQGSVVYHLETGDCLQLGPPAPTTFHNPTNEPTRYLAAIVKSR